MSKQLGKGLGALLSDRSQPTLDTSDKYKAIREKEKVLEELQAEVDTESKTLEDLRKRHIEARRNVLAWRRRNAWTRGEDLCRLCLRSAKLIAGYCPDCWSEVVDHKGLEGT